MKMITASKTYTHAGVELEIKLTYDEDLNPDDAFYPFFIMLKSAEDDVRKAHGACIQEYARKKKP